MKTKILVLMLALCLILCACGGTASQDNGTTTTQAPTSQVTTTDGTGNADTPLNDPLLDLPSLFPEGFEGIELPPVEFDEDDENGILTSRPVSEITEPPIQDEPEETVETDPPAQTPSTAYTKGDLLPEDQFFEVEE